MTEAEKALDDEIKALVYLCRLSKEEKHQLFRVDDAFKRFDLRSHWPNLIRTVACDRITRAESCLETAEFLYAMNDPSKAALLPEFQRTVVNKAYYSIHQSLRAICLLENGWEADGHQKSISEVKRLLKNEDFQRRSGLAVGVIEELGQARDNRNVADYSPYSFSRREVKAAEHKEATQLSESEFAKHKEKVDWEMISGNNWERAAKFNIELAKKVLKAADAIWKGS